MDCTTSGSLDVRKCLVLVALEPPKTGRQGRVWDFDSDELAPATALAITRHGRCAHCGAEGTPMLRVLHEGRALAFCDNGECALEVDRVISFEPHGSFDGLHGVEYMGIYTCACGRVHIVGGPLGNWTLGYCPDPCGRAVLVQPDRAALLEVAS